MPVIVNPKHELMAQALANGKTQEVAYVTAGYSAKGARGSSTRLLNNNPHVRLRTSELLAERERMQAKAGTIASEKLAVDIASVLQEAACIAFSDPRKLFREDGSLKAITEIDDNTRASIASIEIVENFKTIGGRVVKVEGKADEKSYIKKVKFWDKNSALEKLMKHLSMFTARVEHGKPGKFAHMTEEELQREIVVTARRLGFTISDGRTRAKRSPEKPEESEEPDTVH